MGGSKSRDVPSNIVVLCSLYNGLIESQVESAKQAKSYGWKLETWQEPKNEPVYDTLKGEWFLLDDNFGRKVVQQGRTTHAVDSRAPHF